MVTFTKLTTIFVLGGISIPITGYIMRWIIQGKVKRSQVHQDALKVLQSDHFPKKLLGEPIVAGSFDSGNTKYYGYRDNIRWVSIPVKGPHASGYLKYYYHNDSDKLLKIELMDTECSKVFFAKDLN